MRAQITTLVRKASQRGVERRWVLSGLLLGAFVLGLFIVHSQLATPGRFPLYDDEPAYVGPAQEAMRSGNLSLLPGSILHTHRPPLAVPVFGRILEASDDLASGITNIRHFQVGLLMLVIVCTYLHAALLRLGPWWSLLPPALLGLFPWFGFYAHTILSEMLHAALQSLALGFVLAYCRWQRVWLLVPAGVLIGYALLTRSTLQLFSALLLPLLAAEALRTQRAESRPWKHSFRVLVPPLALLLSIALVLTPQMAKNAERGYGWTTATNTWRNLEFGFRRPAKGDAKEVDSIEWVQMERLYPRGGKSEPARERASKKRTLAFLHSLPLREHVRRQLDKASYAALSRRELYEKQLHSKRWPKAWKPLVKRMAKPGRRLWNVMLLTTAVFVLPACWLGRGWRVLGLYVITYTASFLLVPLHTRFFIQSPPVLVLYFGAAGVLVTAGVKHLMRRIPRSRPER